MKILTKTEIARALLILNQISDMMATKEEIDWGYKDGCKLALVRPGRLSPVSTPFVTAELIDMLDTQIRLMHDYIDLLMQ